jgi:membrane-associated phospholipid phosphatase
MANPVGEFCRQNWDLDFRAELYKAEFFATRAWQSSRADLVAPWSGSTREELACLRALQARDRAQHLVEITLEQQGAVMAGYGFGVLGVAAGKSPRTAELLRATLYLAGCVSTFVKAQFNRVRPWVLAPDLAPPIPLPAYPSFPGGHATQMGLLFLTLTELRPDRVESARFVAREVSRNRVRAGLNYPSDTKGGTDLARRIFDILRSDCDLFRKTLEEARGEMPPRA